MSAGGRYSCRIATNTFNSLTDSPPQRQFTTEFEFCSELLIIIVELNLKSTFCTAVPNITSLKLTPNNPRIGKPFFIECTVSGIPMANIFWRMEGILLNQTNALYDCNSRFRIIPFLNRNSSRLSISAASIDFNGMYECVVANDAGTDSVPIHIKLQGQL